MPDQRVLLVEGRGDRHIFANLFAHHRIPEGLIRIREADGYENLREIASVMLAVDIGSDLERLGIVVDADTGLAPRWQSVGDLLRRAGYTNVPDVPEAPGTILQEEGRPTVGVWVMPDNATPGMLEDFAGHLIRPRDRLWTRARRSVDTIPASQRRFPSAHLSKAYIHTWLAWQERPGVPMGSAIHERYLDADAPSALRLIAWIRTLFAV